MEDKLCLYSGTWFFCRWFDIENIFFDRIKEIAILTGGITNKQFLYRYYLILKIPIVGNAAHALTLFDFRFMIFGSDSCLMHIKYLHTTTGITSNTKIFVIYFTEGTQLIRPSCTQTAMATHSKILYYYGKKKKIFDRMFDLPGHIIYWIIAFRAHKNISKEIKKNIFFLPFRWVRCWKQRVNAII